MIVNARMYAPTAAIGTRWRELFARLMPSGHSLLWLEHPAPAALDALWRRTDNGAVFMCGLPFSSDTYAVTPLAAPVPSPPRYQGRPRYCSEFVVRADSRFRRLEDTFGERIAFSSPDSQSGFAAALEHLQPFASQAPLYREVIAPCVTPGGSLKAVLDGLAEVAPIDSWVLDLLRRHEPALTEPLRTVAQTEFTAPPLLVASRGADMSPLREALLACHRREDLRALREALLLERFAAVEVQEYPNLQARFAAARNVWRARALATHVDAAFE